MAGILRLQAEEELVKLIYWCHTKPFGHVVVRRYAGPLDEDWRTRTAMVESGDNEAVHCIDFEEATPLAAFLIDGLRRWDETNPFHDSEEKWAADRAGFEKDREARRQDSRKTKETK